MRGITLRSGRNRERKEGQNENEKKELFTRFLIVSLLIRSVDASDISKTCL